MSSSSSSSSSTSSLAVSLIHAPSNSIYVNGVWTKPKGSSTFDVVDPSQNTVIASVPISSGEDVDDAVKAASAAFKAWSQLTGAARAVYLSEISKVILDDKDRLANLEALNSGKSLQEALGDISDTASCFQYFADLAPTIDAKQGVAVSLPDPDYSAQLFYESKGVVAAIIPWNYPLLMAAWKIAPALAAGCTVVLKPAELTPLTALELAELIVKKTQLPKGVLNIVPGAGSTGGFLSNHLGVDKLAFTGSTVTGKKVAAAAALNIKQCNLELGGKSAAIVLDDASNLDKIVEWVAFGVFANNGQVCSSTSRLLIHSSLYDRFLSRLVSLTRSIPVGAPLSSHLRDRKGHVGPVVSKLQYDKIVDIVNTAVKEDGCKMLTQSEFTGPDELEKYPELKNGFFIRPTILEVSDIRKARVWNLEVFGPILSVCKFETVEEAIAIANDTEYGLACAVFSHDVKQALSVARQIRVGISWINCSQPTFVQLPWGGTKASGIGRELGELGLASYLEPRQVVTSVSSGPLGWYTFPKSD